jgi:GNAT superfamily N-acetyltransferase
MIPTNLSIRKICQLALTHRLFVNTWCLRSELETFVKYERGIRHAALYFDGETPVAVAIIGTSADVQIFVRQKYRRQGIGRKLVEHMRKHAGEDGARMDAGYGIKGSLRFWDAVGVPTW